MKRYFNFTIIMLLLLFLMGMGGIGGTPEGSIPIPNTDFKATITDINSVDTMCSFVSIDGKDFLKGKRGAASVTIPFEKIATISISTSGDAKDVNVALKLADSNEIKLKVSGNSDVFGKTDFGTVQIKMREVSKIDFSVR